MHSTIWLICICINSVICTYSWSFLRKYCDILLWTWRVVVLNDVNEIWYIFYWYYWLISFLFYSIGYPMVTLGFGFKSYVSYKLRLVSCISLLYCFLCFFSHIHILFIYNKNNPWSLYSVVYAVMHQWIKT